MYMKFTPEQFLFFIAPSIFYTTIQKRRRKQRIMGKLRHFITQPKLFHENSVCQIQCEGVMNFEKVAQAMGGTLRGTFE